MDYIFLEINDAFEEMTGLKRDKVIGKKVTEVLPGLDKSGFDWIGTYNQVTLNGEPARLENYSVPLKRWYDVSIYSDKPGYFGLLFHDITQAKIVEQENEEKAEHYRGLVDNAGDLIQCVDGDGKILYVNQEWLATLGYSAEEINSLALWNIIHPDSLEHCMAALQQVAAGEDVDEVEAVFTAKDGTPVMVEGKVNRKVDASGRFVNTQGIFRNITGRKKAEQALQESETKLKGYINNAPYGVFVHNEKGEYLEANKKACLMSGYSEEELLGMNISQFSPQAERQRSRHHFNNLTEQGSGFFEIPHILKDGTLRNWSINVVKLSDTRFLGFAQDITERKRAEDALRESELRSRALVGAIPDLLFRYNREGVYREAVVKDEELLHAKTRNLYRQNDLVGKKVAEVLPAPIAEKLMAAIEKALARGKIQILEYSYPLNNSEHSFEARLAPIGETEVVSIVRDITVRKKQEAELQYISFHDQLTGLYNRHYFENELQRVGGAREHPVAVISADLDGLKLVNDTRGHSEGDSYLQAGAEMLKSALRTSDILARVGGDEFALILPRTTQKAGEELVARIRRQIEEYNRRQAGFPLSISIGLAVSEHSEYSLEETYKKADDAMYTDKLKRGKKARTEIVTSLLASLYKRGDLGEGAREQVQELSVQLGQALNLDERRMADLELLSQAYDLGKVSMPDHLVHSSLLRKSGELTEAEREAIHRHPETGYQIASSSPELAGVADLILKHHENFDGSGYPLGLKGKEIPVECRILAIATAYSAMVNPRTYAKTFAKAKAIKELQRCAGTQFDPELVERFSLIAE